MSTDGRLTDYNLRNVPGMGPECDCTLPRYETGTEVEELGNSLDK